MRKGKHGSLTHVGELLPGLAGFEQFKTTTPPTETKALTVQLKSAETNLPSPSFSCEDDRPFSEVSVLQFISAEPQLVEMLEHRVAVHIDSDRADKPLRLKKSRRYRPLLLQVWMARASFIRLYSVLNAQAVLPTFFKLCEAGVGT
jgi:hypothetical protein